MDWQEQIRICGSNHYRSVTDCELPPLFSGEQRCSFFFREFMRMFFNELRLTRIRTRISIGQSPVGKSRAAVLVVDDQPAVVQLVVHLLRRLGFERIGTAFDGVSALERIARTEYDLIISDFQMDPMTGLDLLRAVRSNWKTRSAAFLMMAGGTEVEKISAASHAGMDGYLLKPFRAAALETKIENAFQTRRVGTFV